MNSYLTILFSTFFVGFTTVFIPGPILFVIVELALEKKIRPILWFLLGTYLVDLIAFLIILLGFQGWLQNQLYLNLVGIAGGAVLAGFGIQAFNTSIRPNPDGSSVRYIRRSGQPLMLGILVAGTNPLYWIWWATVGTNFTLQSLPIGIWAAWIMFWVLIVSTGLGSLFIAYLLMKSTNWIQTSTYHWMIRVCSLGLIVFGVYFLVISIVRW